MLKHFKSSPLWLIGLFALIADGMAALAAVNLSGWAQGVMVIFVIVYIAAVTSTFFLFLWKKPQNFYSPSDYRDLPPRDFVSGLQGLPKEAATEFKLLEANPSEVDVLYSLMSKLMSETIKQHLILIMKIGQLDISERIDRYRTSHRYVYVLRDGGNAAGMFVPEEMLRKLEGTELLDMSDANIIRLTKRGSDLASWLIRNAHDAKYFYSNKGSWGNKQNIDPEISKWIDLQDKDNSEKEE
jgi:hypothetical protein